MERLVRLCGRITDIFEKPLILEEPFEDVAHRFSTRQGTVVLLSGGNLDCARYQVLAARPWLTFTGRHNQMVIRTGAETLTLQANPFQVLRRITDALHVTGTDIPMPVGAGLFGYLSYDLKDALEVLPRTSVEEYPLPHICMFAPTFIVVHDSATDSTRLLIPRGSHVDTNGLTDIITDVETTLSAPYREESQQHGVGSYRSNFTRQGYIDAVNQVKAYIASGHVYQVNMSQRFETSFSGDPFALFKELFRRNPAPFFAYINAGDHHVLSTSPERFLRQRGKRIETRPIKGTRPRGSSPEADDTLKQELRESRKDDAELSMIVDLLRNDMNKVCRPGSVRVKDHKRLEAYQNVYHLVSIVEGVLRPDCGAIDLITATFPGGSITGCPKIRAMEIIDELEPTRRHLYTGAIGYIGFHDTMDLSIAIRTATLQHERLIFSVGGGIVFDSDPAAEYDETLHKGETLMQAFTNPTALPRRPRMVWFNGALKRAAEVGIPISDEGFLFGYGFFETIRVDSGQPHLLERHISRFNDTWEALFPDSPPDLTWETVIAQTLRANDLTNDTAAVKIIATMGPDSQPPYHHNLLVTARSYVHRLKGRKTWGLRLVTYPHSRQSPLADHKTLNYLFYLLAGRWATKRQGHEALILNPDGTISETNSGNIILIKGERALRPCSDHVLPGVMEGEIGRLLSEWGYTLAREPLTEGDVVDADAVLVTNSLIGAVPACVLNEKRLRELPDLEKKIGEALFPVNKTEAHHY